MRAAGPPRCARAAELRNWVLALHKLPNSWLSPRIGVGVFFCLFVFVFIRLTNKIFKVTKARGVWERKPVLLNKASSTRVSAFEFRGTIPIKV